MLAIDEAALKQVLFGSIILDTKSRYRLGGCSSGTVSTELPGRHASTQGHGYK